MRPIELARKYLEIFYSGKNIEELSRILSDNMTFNGPLYEFHSASDYLKSLIADPPEDMKYQIIEEYENESSACIIYEFSKPGINVPMAQIFQIDKDRITKILLIFNAKTFI